MPFQFSNEEYADIIFVYGFCNGNSEAARREYQERFPGRRIPNTKTFSSVYQHLRTRGSFPTCSFSVERQVNHRVNDELCVINHIQHSPGTSTRRISYRTGLSKNKVWRILHKENLYPFRLQKVQNLLPTDYPQRLNFCHWLLDNADKVYSILFTDEATFTRNGVFNSRNTHLWSEENPHGAVETSFQHRFHINVWCGVIDDKILGPFVFNENLTGDAYAHFLKNNLPVLLEDVPLQTRLQMIYQHDGATPHFSLVARQHLNANFLNWIGRGGPINWPPRSPDLTPLDYFIWGHMKTIVYQQKVDTKEELLIRIQNATEFIRNDPEMIRRATGNMLRRAECCVHCEGRNFEQLL
jgi:hypothetical protein